MGTKGEMRFHFLPLILEIKYLLLQIGYEYVWHFQAY